MRSSLLHWIPWAAAAYETSIVSLDLPARGDYSMRSRCWRWKSAVLGDDLSLRRPRALRAIASLVERESPAIRDCVLLSTCARLDFLLSHSGEPFEAVAAVIGRQVAELHWLSSPLLPFDAGSDLIAAADRSRGIDVREALTPRLGLDRAAHHLCLVATAADDFDPRCSRRAHVAHQVKSCRPTPALKALVDTALAAGKEARDPRVLENRRFDRTDQRSVAAAAARARAVAAKHADRLCDDVILAPLLERFRRDAQSRLDALPRDDAKALLHRATLDLRRDALAAIRAARPLPPLDDLDALLASAARAL